jgi:predicted RNase H-like HicB family nuclease
MSSYVALIHKDRRSDYGVSFPQFPGLVTAGRTLEEAHRLAEEALAFHVEGMIEDGLAVPEPAPPEEVIKAWKGPTPAWTVIVRLTGPKPKTVRVNISVSSADLAMIDRLAREHGLNRSDFIARSAHAVDRLSKTAKAGAAHSAGKAGFGNLFARATSSMRRDMRTGTEDKQATHRQSVRPASQKTRQAS